jgi:hypothetical protein
MNKKLSIDYNQVIVPVIIAVTVAAASLVASCAGRLSSPSPFSKS